MSVVVEILSLDSQRFDAIISQLNRISLI